MFTNKIQIFSKEAIDGAIEHCRLKWPEEGCGAIINDEFVPFENEAEDKEKDFLINDNRFYEEYENGKIQCVIHSHENSPHASEAGELPDPWCRRRAQ